MKRLIGVTLFLVLTLLILFPSAWVAHAATEVRVFVANGASDTVSVISASTDTVIATISVGDNPLQIALTPDDSKAYVINFGSDDVSAINTSTNTVITTISLGSGADPFDICITPDGTQAYVSNRGTNSYSVINTLTNTLVSTVPLSGFGLPIGPTGVGCRPDNSEFWIGGGGGGAAGDRILTFTHPGQGPAGTVSDVLGGDQIKFLPDSSYGYALNGCGSCGNIQRVSTASKTVDASYFFGGNGVVGTLAVAPDGSAIYAAALNGTQLFRFDPSLSVTGTLAAPMQFNGGQDITPDSSFLYLSTWNGTSGHVLKVNAASLAVVATIPVGDDPRGIAIATVSLNTYVFSGFFQPVDNLPTLNSVKAGSAIPVKFSLNGNQGLNIFAAGYPTSTSTTCGTTAVDAIEQTVTAGSSSLAYDASADQYSYVWKTNKTWAGTCRTLVVKLDDGSYHYANFQFK